ncbi:MAG TPA: LptA/OstA family protein, partial [Vicinamibacterales bacterium]|nr:LptA/OstA family protein [Vicinamibacterales bacterium]
MLKVKAQRLLFALAVATVASVASAQQPALDPVSGIDSVVSSRWRQIGDDQRQYETDVEVKLGDTMLYADYVEVFMKEDRIVARGNVALVQATNRITADSAEFNYKTRLGVFHSAYGIATIKPQAPRPGAVALPNASNQDTDVYFVGEVVEKVGPRKYKITKGGFTTCVQPTPRWELHADTVILNIDHYTFLRNAIFNVK